MMIFLLLNLIDGKKLFGNAVEVAGVQERPALIDKRCYCERPYLLRCHECMRGAGCGTARATETPKLSGTIEQTRQVQKP